MTEGRMGPNEALFGLQPAPSDSKVAQTAQLCRIHGRAALPSLAVFAVGAGTRFPPHFPSLLGLRVRAGLSFLHSRVLVSQPVSARAVKTQLSTVVTWKKT